MNFERKNIQSMTGYSPGEQPVTAEIIKLNTNENPFPPGPAVKQALAELKAEDLRCYPPPTALELRHAIAEHHDLDKDNILVTNGGDELLRLTISTFVESTEIIAVAEPTYTLYEVLAKAQGCDLMRFKLNPDWSLPENFAAQLNAAKVKLCLLPNPHAPSGSLLSIEVMRALATEFKGLLLIDEAYIDFVDPDLHHDCSALVTEFDNVLLLRTFSKGYSLAGLRIGYGIGAKSLISPMQYKTKDSYNTDYIAQKLALAALQDQSYARKSWEAVREQRADLMTALTDLAFSCEPSQTNFILATAPKSMDAEALYLALKNAGILVRYFKHEGLQDKLRISIGKPEENQALASTLKKLLS